MGTRSPLATIENYGRKGVAPRSPEAADNDDPVQRAAMDDYASQLAKQRERTALLEHELGTTENRLAEKQQAYTRLDREKAEIETELKTLRPACDAKHEEVEKLSAELSALSVEMRQLASLCKEKEEELKLLRESASKHQAKQMEATAEAENMKARLQEGLEVGARYEVLLLQKYRGYVWQAYKVDEVAGLVAKLNMVYGGLPAYCGGLADTSLLSRAAATDAACDGLASYGGAAHVELADTAATALVTELKTCLSTLIIQVKSLGSWYEEGQKGLAAWEEQREAQARARATDTTEMAARIQGLHAAVAAQEARCQALAIHNVSMAAQIQELHAAAAAEEAGRQALATDKASMAAQIEELHAAGAAEEARRQTLDRAHATEVTRMETQLRELEARAEAQREGLAAEKRVLVHELSQRLAGAEAAGKVAKQSATRSQGVIAELRGQLQHLEAAKRAAKEARAAERASNRALEELRNRSLGSEASKELAEERLHGLWHFTYAFITAATFLFVGVLYAC